MSLKVKLLSKLALLAVFAAFTVAAMAQDNSKPTDQGAVGTQDNAPRKGFGRHGGGDFHGPHGGPGMMMGELRGITLTDAQKQQIHTIMETNKPDQASMEQMRTLMEARRAGTLTADQKEQFKTIRQQGRAKAESVHQQIQSILTSDQIAQIEKNKQERKERFEKRRLEREQKAPTVTEKPTDN